MKRKQDLTREYYDRKIFIYSSALDRVRSGLPIVMGTSYYCISFDHIYGSEGVYYDIDKGCLEHGVYYYDSGPRYPRSVSYSEETLKNEIKYYSKAKENVKEEEPVLVLKR